MLLRFCQKCVYWCRRDEMISM